MASSLKIGDQVGFSAAFLRSTGQHTGPVPFRKGQIMEIEEVSPGFTLATVYWNGEHKTTRANIKNLARVGTLAWAGV